jgi:two-component system OmpR family response regulator
MMCEYCGGDTLRQLLELSRLEGTTRTLARIEQLEARLGSIPQVPTSNPEISLAVDGRDPLEVGELVIDRQGRQVMLGKKYIHLSKTEFQLLVYLALQAGRVVPYDELLEFVWEFPPETGDRHIVASCMRRLRKKLGEAIIGLNYIMAIRGVGYCLREPNTGSGFQTANKVVTKVALN